MGEAKRRKQKDPNFGIVPKKLLKKPPQTPHVQFIKFNGEIYAGNHNPLPGDALLKPFRQCNQYQEHQTFMDSQAQYLTTQSDGKWMYASTEGWKRAEISLPEIFEIIKHDPSAEGLITPHTPMAIATYDGYSNQVSPPASPDSQSENSQFSQYGTICQPGVIRLSAIVKSEDREWIYCQGLSDLQPYKVKKEYFYPYGHPYSSMSIAVQIDRYEKQDPVKIELEYQKSAIEVA